MNTRGIRRRDVWLASSNPYAVLTYETHLENPPRRFCDCHGSVCQASATVAPTETVAPPESAAPTETTAGQAPTTEGTVAETAPTTGAAQPSGVDGPVAPDFEFTLDDGSTFVLSEEAMPVYMVFWAEW